MEKIGLRFNKDMLAYCGLYCEQCSFKLAYDEQNQEHLKHIPYQFVQENLSEYDCEGCKKDNMYPNHCSIKNCASTKMIDSCADCGTFPCEYIIEFENDGKPHHKNAIENLRCIRENGIELWYEKIKATLICICGKKKSWYYACPIHKI